MALAVILADDHQIVRQGLKVLLQREGFNVVGEAANGLEAVQLAKTLQPEIAVIDLAMPLLNGLDTVREILKASSKTKSILLTVHSETHYILEGLQAGAKGFVMKTHAVEDLVRAIREASRDRTYLSPEISETLVQVYQGKLHTAGPVEPSRAAGLATCGGV